jgi:NhaP-type Na+/H+ and K+/H+ antiporter
MCKTQKKTPVTPEILKETMETISKDTNNVSSVIEKLLEVYQTATQKNQKAIGDFAATLTFNYWLNNATSSSNFDLKEIVLLKHNPWNGQKIRDLDISRQTFIVLVDRDGKMLKPHGELVLEENDKLLVYTKENIRKYTREPLF